MTDRELIELAAKAAGYEVVGLASRHIAQGVHEDDLLIRNDKGGDSVWNPRRYDGDALRLAVKLGLGVFGPTDDDPIAIARKDGTGICIEEPAGNDHYDATRRAILRAAAEFGKHSTIREENLALVAKLRQQRAEKG